MNDILLALHFVGLALGAGGGFASALVMRRAAAAAGAEQAMTLRGLGPGLARLSTTGLALMWATGLGLAWERGGFTALPPLFWVKFLFVTTLTLAAITIEWTYAQIGSGNTAAAARLPLLGPIAGVSSLLAVLFAALTFH